MKNIVLDEVKKELNLKEKAFTKKKKTIIINKDYNPLKVNYRIYEREGLCMKKAKNEILKEYRDNISSSLSFKEKIIVRVFPKTFIKVHKKGIEKGFNSVI